ncbi:phosphocarrier protein [Dongia mobilis]|uniref:Phosphocarrier protein n=1 Tax=Dongia mobilis TaxID=578943 RepID=A0A4R6WQC3_9PROT|nr:HPr family phosphocarrier protein [Dongia mobilis]TDQ83424.1 phosphocarrier protein [Dongia mobilis]
MSGENRITARARICNQKGLHARAAAKFVKTSGGFDADIRVAKGEMDVSGGSIMGLMMLAAGIGSELEIQASGPEADRAVAALVDLIARKFDEE